MFILIGVRRHETKKKPILPKSIYLLLLLLLLTSPLLMGLEHAINM